MSNKNETSKSHEHTDDSLGIIFNEIKLPDAHNTAYIAPTSPTTHATPSQNFSSHISDTNPETSFLDGGTIITDRRKKRASIKDNLNAAFTEWWGNTKQKLEGTFEVIERTIIEPKNQHPLVEDVDARINVVKKAATYTAQAPKDDHKTTVEKIATIHKESAQTIAQPILIKEASKPREETGGWSHHVEESPVVAPIPESTLQGAIPDKTPTSLPDSIIAPIVNLSDIQTYSTPSKKVTQTPATPQSPDMFVVTQTSENKTPQAERYGESYSTTVEPAPERVFEVPVMDTPSVQRDIPPIPTPSLHGTPSVSDAEQTFRSQRFVSTQPTSFADVSQNSTVRSIIKGLIILALVVAGIVLALFASSQFSPLQKSPTTDIDAIPVVIPQIFKTDSQTAIPLSPNKSAFLTDLTTAIENAPHGVSQFYPVVTSETNRHSASASELIALLDTHFSAQLVHTLEETVVLGSVTALKNEPFIVLQSFNFDVLFSGFLDAEQYLRADLSPLFGFSDDPTDTFTDMVIQNKSTRVLKDTQGNIILLYAFINRNTVIITSTEAALVTLLDRF